LGIRVFNFSKLSLFRVGSRFDAETHRLDPHPVEVEPAELFEDGILRQEGRPAGALSIDEASGPVFDYLVGQHRQLPHRWPRVVAPALIGNCHGLQRTADR
jgi:hypothetical protein